MQNSSYFFCIFCAFFLHVFAFFVRFFGFFFSFFFFFLRFLKETHKKCKNIAKKTQIQSKKMQRQRPERFWSHSFCFLIAFCFAFFVHCFCILCAFFVHFFAFFVRFLHWFSGQMRFFAFFLRLFCIPRHPLVTCFCVFCAFFSGLVLHYFCIVYAFFMFCCVIRTSFSVHHNYRWKQPLVLVDIGGSHTKKPALPRMIQTWSWKVHGFLQPHCAADPLRGLGGSRTPATP